MANLIARKNSINDIQVKKSNDLIPVDFAVERVLRLAKPIKETEIIALANSSNRILAQSIFSNIAQPPFDNSAMDGYGICLDELKGDAPWELEITAKITAGDIVKNLPISGAIRIFTGAPVPQKIDAVIMQEHVKLNGDKVIITKKPNKGDNIRKHGENISKDQILLEQGELMTPQAMALVASCGCSEMEVRPKVKVAFFSTGSELCQPGEDLQPSQIYNSNRFLLQGLLDQNMIELVDLGSVPDDKQAISNILQQAASVSDIVISSGSVLFAEQTDAGKNLQTLKLAMRPAKPMVFGEIDDAIYIGLPGNPLAAFVTYNMIAKPIIEKRAGLKEKTLLNIPAVSNFKRARRLMRAEYVPVKKTGYSNEGLLLLNMLGKARSSEILPLAKADGLAVISAGSGEIAIGDKVKYIPL